MAYNYKYIPAGLLITGKRGKTPKDDYVSLFQETLNNQFYNSSDWWTIQEETYTGSREYVELDVRINHVISTETGMDLGDDWKGLLFKDIDHAIELGKRYIFDGNTWMTINTEFYKGLAGTCTVRRCNNVLRWIDEPTGIYYEEPCCVKYELKEPRDYATSGSPFKTPGGFMHMWTQFNDNTNEIRENQRFLLGNPGHWTAYKVIGSGLNDFRGDITDKNDSVKLLVIDLAVDYVNEQLDDITNGIASVNKNIYTLTLNRAIAEGKIGDTIQLIANITYNGDTATRNVLWETSGFGIASVTDMGLVTLKKNGTCTITATIEGNPVSTTCGITVKASPATNVDIMISPDENYILESEDQIYEVWLYENDVIQGDTFTITCDTRAVPLECYGFTQVDGNHFHVWNKLRCITSYLTVNCVSGTNTRAFDIYLRGAWLNDNAG